MFQIVMRLPIIVLALTACLPAFAQEKKKIENYEMTTYIVALLKAGPNQSHSKEEAQKIQAGHMAHINQMAESKKLVLAGPFADRTELRGIFVFSCSMEEARALTAEDPAVKAGRLIMELHPWLSAKGIGIVPSEEKK